MLYSKGVVNRVTFKLKKNNLIINNLIYYIMNDNTKRHIQDQVKYQPEN